MARDKPESSRAESYSERKITQIRELKNLLWGLDLDEGIRFVAEVPGFEKSAFVFVTKCDDKYCISVKEQIRDETSSELIPGGKEQWKYFETAEAAWNYMSKLLKHPFEAFYY